MLHIHNGDCSANTAKQSPLGGEHFAWREELIEGPTPNSLDPAEWRRVRAQHLCESYDLDSKECERGLLDQEKKLESFQEYEEVVLWFEHDLFCQVHLLYLLNWFSQRDLGKTKLSLICVGRFPGKQDFRGLGELNADQLASLFPERHQVAKNELYLAASAWQAYCSSDPTYIERLLQTDTSFMPFLRAALIAHLRRFPSTRNGLGAIENLGLELINGGLSSFIDVFPRFGDAEPVYGLGDAQFWFALQRVTLAKQPLLKLENGENASKEMNGGHDRSRLSLDRIRKTRFELTELGRSALRGEADFVALNGIDLWLGGVHLQDKNNTWRWNEPSGTIVFT
ncbi:MAG: RNA polymerase subunit sigma-24 [Acidobacteriota bacterium]|nr:RNA polymerase subunit sigma-24 [Acidobacteriota bacterium]